MARRRRDVPDTEFDAERMRATVAVLRERLDRKPQDVPEGMTSPAARSAALFEKAATREAFVLAKRSLARAPQELSKSLRAALPQPFGAATPVDNPKVNVQMVLRK